MANFPTSSSGKINLQKDQLPVTNHKPMVSSVGGNEHEPRFYLTLGILLGLIIALVVVVTFLYFPLVIAQEFQDPTIRLMSIEESPFSVSSNVSHTSIIQNGVDNWNITFLVTKPNDDYIFFYNDIEAKITYQDIVLWQANPASFYQEENSQTFIDATFDAMPKNYPDWVGQSISNDLTVGRPIKFLVSLNGKVEISSYYARCDSSCGELQVSCEGLEVEFLRNINFGKLSKFSDVCKVHLKKASC